VLTDFDGTLAPIVDDPAAAAPLPGTQEVLGRLAGMVGAFAVVSGRPVAYLRSRLGDDLHLVGLYGLERWDGAEATEAPEATAWRAAVEAATARAEAAFPGAVEAKGLSLTLHTRTRPELAQEVRAWADGEATATGLVVRTAKASVELHPPVKLDKGTVVERLAAGMGAACFLGDDVGDLPAFDALDRLAAAGLVTARIAVRTEESPPAMLSRADLVVDGPAGALALLERFSRAS
jgi:trehalose 6-phosphate phosphatase